MSCLCQKGQQAHVQHMPLEGNQCQIWKDKLLVLVILWKELLAA